MEKRLLISVIIPSFCLMLLATAVAAPRTQTVQMGKGEARISTLDGAAHVLVAGKGAPHALKSGDRLHGADEVTIGAKSRLEVVMPDGSQVRFADNTRFRLLQLEAGDQVHPRSIKVNMVVGRAWANVSRAVGSKGRFELQYENAVAGVRGTVYRMNVNEDKSAVVKVYDGNVHVTGGVPDPPKAPVAVGPPKKIAGPVPVAGPRKVSMEEWVYIVKSMQQIQIRPDGSADKPKAFTATEDRDPWVDWNKARDRVK